MPCVDSECTQFAVLFHFALLSVYMWRAPIVSGTIVLLKTGSLHLLFCPISFPTRGAKQKKDLHNQLTIGIEELKLYSAVHGETLSSVNHL